MSLSASETKSAYFGIGRRKTSVAKVILVPGNGSMIVNQKLGESYLQFNSQYINASKIPLTTLGLEKMYDIYVSTLTCTYILSNVFGSRIHRPFFLS